MRKRKQDIISIFKEIAKVASLLTETTAPSLAALVASSAAAHLVASSCAAELVA
jgi:hypothetical protein